jgi:hypothetical protein
LRSGAVGGSGLVRCRAVVGAAQDEVWRVLARLSDLGSLLLTLLFLQRVQRALGWWHRGASGGRLGRRPWRLLRRDRPRGDQECEQDSQDAYHLISPLMCD